MFCVVSDLVMLQRLWLATVVALGGWLMVRLICVRPPSSRTAWADALLVVTLAAFTGIGYVGEATPVGEASAAAPAVLSVSQMLAGAFMQVQIGFFLVLYLVLTKRLPVTFLGLKHQGAWRVLGHAVIGLIATLLVMNVVDYAWHHWVLQTAAPEQSDQAIVHTFLQSNATSTQLVLIVSACVVAPIVEELMYRGLMFGLGRAIIGTRVAAILAAMLFALAHADAVAALPLFLLGLGFTIMYLRTGSLLVPVVMHALFNALNLWQMSQ